MGFGPPTEPPAVVAAIADHPPGEAAQPSTPREAARNPAPPANDDRKPAIVTTRKRGSGLPTYPT